MDDISEFVARCDALAKRRGWKRSTLSTTLFRDGKRLDKLALGYADMGVRRFAKARAELTVLEAETPSDRQAAA